MSTEATPQQQELKPPEDKAGSAVAGLVVLGMVIAAAAFFWFNRESDDVAVKVNKRDLKYPRPEVSPTGPYPKVVIEKDYFFGQMELGQSRQHTYLVTNKGEANLVLKHGPKSCDCTRYEIEKSILKPGESGNILVEWLPKKQENIFRQTMNLYTNDPDAVVVQLSVSGTVASLLNIMPRGEWDLGNIDEPGRGRVEGVVSTGLLDEVKIIDIEKSDPRIQVELVQADDAEIRELNAIDAVEMIVSVSKDIPAGAFRGTISFGIEGQEDRHTINIRAHREGSVRFVGTGSVFFDKRRAFVDLGQFPASRGTKGEILMYLSGEHQTMNVTDVTTQPSFLKVSLNKDETFKPAGTTRYILTFDVPAGSPAGGYLREKSGRVVIKTDHPEYPEIALTVKFLATNDVGKAK